LLSALRQAGLCIESVSLTSGLVSGAHGVQLVPDLALTDIGCLINTATIELVILPAGGRCLARLKVDPRVHRLLHQVVAQRGQIVTDLQGLQVLRAAAVWVDGELSEVDDQATVLLRDPEKSPETFAQDLIRRLKRWLRNIRRYHCLIQSTVYSI
jgi:hypothetical protein